MQNQNAELIAELIAEPFSEPAYLYCLIAISIPVQNPCRTRAEPVQNPCRTPAEPCRIVQNPLQSVCKPALSSEEPFGGVLCINIIAVCQAVCELVQSSCVIPVIPLTDTAILDLDMPFSPVIWY